MKKALRAVVMIIMLSSVCFAADGDKDVSEKLSKTYPQLRITSVSPSPLQGLYEVVTGDNIIYYHPETDLFFFGEIITKEGKSLTGEKVATLMAAKMKEIDITQALKIGTGKHSVIEFTDPDCPYCRMASNYLQGKDVTRHIFFYPLPMHPKAEDKARYILCSKDKQKAYEEVMSGELDNKEIAVCSDETVQTLLDEHKKAARTVGVQGTPTLVVNGTLVAGANFAQIDRLLNSHEETK